MMKAVILAGGFGKRLMPLTMNTPKPMLKICNQPMIDYCISQASYYDVLDLTLTLAYQPQEITNWCDGYKDIKFHYSLENEPLGTFGGVKKALSEPDDEFFVLSGDGINDLNLYEMMKSHHKSGAEVTIAVTYSSTPSLYGVVEIDEKSYVKSFYEKPTTFKGNTVNTGIYIINKSVLSFLSDGYFDFAKDLFPIVLKKGRINVFYHEGYWNDVGNPKSYFETNFFMKNKKFFPFATNCLRENDAFFRI